MSVLQIKEIQTADYVTKSNLPFCDYVINPYTGCPHGCRYCYASFMKRFTGHTEEWGTFVDVKRCKKAISAKKLSGKTVFLSSVTDPYNPLEKKYEITRMILEQLSHIDCTVSISTKSSLILRDMDLLKECKNVIVDLSLNTLDENFRRDMDKASSVEERLRTLKELHSNGIYTVLFMSPIFPELTDWKQIVETTRTFICEYWFENLNLRGDYKARILSYIAEKYPQYRDLYARIFERGDVSYWKEMELCFTAYCKNNGIPFVNAFNHSSLVQKKKETGNVENITKRNAVKNQQEEP